MKICWKMILNGEINMRQECLKQKKYDLLEDATYQGAEFAEESETDKQLVKLLWRANNQIRKTRICK